MVKIKGLRKLNKSINKFLKKEFGLKATMSTSFAYLEGTNKIHYSLIAEPGSSECFIAYFRSLAPDIKCSCFLASLMHEVGHYFTIDWLTDNEYDYCEDTKCILNALYDEATDVAERVKINHQYFELPIEAYATEWAIAYLRSKPDVVESYWSNIQKAITDFYKVNGIEEGE